MKPTILITGAGGQLGREFTEKYKNNDNVYSFTKSQLDISNSNHILNAFQKINPDILINAAAYTSVNNAEDEHDKAILINATAVDVLSNYCLRFNTIFLHFSTDYIFSGKTNTSYSELDKPDPINHYGKSKLEGERNILASGCKYIIVRTSWLYSQYGDNFLSNIIQQASIKKSLGVISNEIGTPTDTKFIVDCLEKFINDSIFLNTNINNIFNLVPNGHVSRDVFAKKILLHLCDLDYKLDCVIEPIDMLPTQKVMRPTFSALSNRKISNALSINLLSWEDILKNFLNKNCEKIKNLIDHK